jgi:hypothetical protein
VSVATGTETAHTPTIEKKLAGKRKPPRDVKTYPTSSPAQDSSEQPT